MAEAPQTPHRRAKRTPALPVVIAGGVSALLLAFSLTPTFSAFTAAITNNNNTAGTGTLIMKEESGGNTCYSTASGSTVDANNTNASCSINKYGGSTTLIPGGSSATTATVTNAGTIPAKVFTLTPSGCVSEKTTGATWTGSGAACSSYTLKVEAGTGTSPSTWVVLYDASKPTGATGTPANFATVYGATGTTSVGVDALAPLGLGTSGLTAGSAVTFRFTVGVPAAANNTFQGVQVNQPLTFNFQS